MTGTRGRAAALLVATAAWSAGCSLEPIDLRSERPLALRTTISAADGSFLARLYRPAGNRALAPLDSVPQTLRDAVLAAEDSRFFNHAGYDLRSIARAALVNISEGTAVQGGSTITQQYVKNAFFRSPGRRTFERKARELRLAIELERRYSKKEILSRYLNTVYLGEGAYGVEVAAENYFRKPVQRLRLNESALLAALIKAPSYYNPRAHPQKALERRNYVLERMTRLDMIDGTEAARAKRQKLGITPAPPRLSVRQPYFIEAVKREVMNDKRLGRNDLARSNMLYKGGLHIRTTLRPRLQRIADNSVRSVLNQRGDPDAALVAIEPDTGEIVAMVGGRDWDASQVNLALGKAGGGSGRQPGSSFKPIVAAAALEAGISLDTQYPASPGTLAIDEDTSWVVRNSEGTSSGSLPLDEALIRSVNAVFARLALEIGADRIAAQGRLMGVRSRLPAYPSIALGSTEVSVVDMAAAFATLANEGTAIEPTTIRSIELPTGEVVRPDQEQVGAVAPGNAWLLSRTLEQVLIRGTGRAAYFGRPAAGKTGTTNDYADAWFVGYTPDLVTAVWVGHPEGRIPMTSVHGMRVWGGTLPATIWRNFMSRALRGTPPRGFQIPRGEIVSVEIDPDTGLLAAPWCPGERRRMLRQLVPGETCPMPPPEVPDPTTTPAPGSNAGRRARPSPEPTVVRAKPSPSSKPRPQPSDKD